MFKFQTHRKRISSHSRATGNASISSTANLKLLTWGKISHAWKSIYDLTLQADNIVYLWYKIIRFVAVGFGRAEAILTQQNVSQVHLRPSSRKSTKGFIQKSHSWTHSRRFRKPKCILEPCCERVRRKSNIEACLILAIYVSSWITRKFTVGNKSIALRHRLSNPTQRLPPSSAGVSLDKI
jgi:hypothetical protein